MQHQLRFIIDENFVLILHKGSASLSHFLRHSGAEHHNLLILWCFLKDVLDLLSHVYK